jgi:hypothetical protein
MRLRTIIISRFTVPLFFAFFLLPIYSGQGTAGLGAFAYNTKTGVGIAAGPNNIHAGTTRTFSAMTGRMEIGLRAAQTDRIERPNLQQVCRRKTGTCYWSAEYPELRGSLGDGIARRWRQEEIAVRGDIDDREGETSQLYQVQNRTRSGKTDLLADSYDNGR